MNGQEKSGPVTVAGKPTNEAERSGSEPVEPRAGAEGNADQPSTRRTQDRENVTEGLDRVRQAARQRKKERFTALLHQPRSAEDGVLRAQAQGRPRRGRDDLDGLRGGTRAKARGSARSGPSRQLSAASVAPDVHTEGGRAAKTAGGRRAGGQDRPERRRHGAERHLRGGLPRVQLRVSALARTADALDALAVGIASRRVNWIVDADIRSFFNSVSQDWLVRLCVQRRLACSAGERPAGARVRSPVVWIGKPRL